MAKTRSWGLSGHFYPKLKTFERQKAPYNYSASHWTRNFWSLTFQQCKKSPHFCDWWNSWKCPCSPETMSPDLRYTKLLKVIKKFPETISEHIIFGNLRTSQIESCGKTRAAQSWHPFHQFLDILNVGSISEKRSKSLIRNLSKSWKSRSWKLWKYWIIMRTISWNLSTPWKINILES